MLRGDDHDFDNTFYVVPPRKQQVRLLYAGSDAADDPQGPAVLPAAGHRPAIRCGKSKSQLRLDDGNVALAATLRRSIVVVDARRSRRRSIAALKTYVERGGTLLWRPRDRDAAAARAALLGRRRAAAKRSRRGRAITCCWARSTSHIRCSPRSPTRATATSRRSTSGSISRWRSKRPMPRPRSSPGSTTAIRPFSSNSARAGSRPHQRLASRRQPARPVEQVRAAGRRRSRPGLRHDAVAWPASTVGEPVALPAVAAARCRGLTSQTAARPAWPPTPRPSTKPTSPASIDAGSGDERAAVCRQPGRRREQHRAAGAGAARTARRAIGRGPDAGRAARPHAPAARHRARKPAEDLAVADRRRARCAGAGNLVGGPRGAADRSNDGGRRHEPASLAV